MFGAPLEAVTADQRRSAKAINFGLIYGMSAFGLAKQLGIPRGAAQEYIDLYFARYPGVKRYMEETRAQAKAQGYVETVFGRRLYLPDINARNKQFQQAAERAAINAPMQGTAADIIKRAMIAVDAWCGIGGRGARIIMQVHDELVLEVETARLAEVTDAVREHMMAAADLRVPLKVDVGHRAQLGRGALAALVAGLTAVGCLAAICLSAVADRCAANVERVTMRPRSSGTVKCSCALIRPS